MQTKQFHLGDVLSITTGRLVSSRNIYGVYDILNFMTGDNLCTHQLPRAIRECEPHLLKKHPELGTAEMDEALAVLDRNLDGVEDKDARERVVRDWLESQVERYGEMLDVAPIPSEAHEVKNPIDEAVEMMGGPEKVVVAITS